MTVAYNPWLSNGAEGIVVSGRGPIQYAAIRVGDYLQLDGEPQSEVGCGATDVTVGHGR